MLIKKTLYAKLAGVSSTAISKACKKGLLKDAVCKNKIDTKSEAARKYLRIRDIDPDTVLPQENNEQEKVSIKSEVPKNENKEAFITSENFDFEAFEKMTLHDIYSIYGTDERFKTMIEAIKKMTDIEKNLIANSVSLGKLVSRDLIKIGIIDPIDSAFATLLTDTSKTISTRAAAMAKAGNDIDEIKKLVVDQISSVIRPAKTKITRILKNA